MIERESDSLKRPTLDFKSLKAAVDGVQYEGGRREPSTKIEPARIDPLRARHPNFRWRLIPAVYCACYGAMFVGALVHFDIYGNALYVGHRSAMLALTHSVLFWCSAFCWFKSYWKCGVLFFVAVIVLNNVVR